MTTSSTATRLAPGAPVLPTSTPSARRRSATVSIDSPDAVDDRALCARLDALIGAMTHLHDSGLLAPDRAVSRTQRRLLELLLHRGSQPLGVLARWLDMNPSTVTRAAQPLAVRGLVSRMTVRGDRRQRVLCLTATGMQLLERTAVRRGENISRIAERLTDLERVVVADAMPILTRIVDEAQNDEAQNDEARNDEAQNDEARNDEARNGACR